MLHWFIVPVMLLCLALRTRGFENLTQIYSRLGFTIPERTWKRSATNELPTHRLHCLRATRSRHRFPPTHRSPPHRLVLRRPALPPCHFYRLRHDNGCTGRRKLSLEVMGAIYRDKSAATCKAFKEGVVGQSRQHPPLGGVGA